MGPSRARFLSLAPIALALAGLAAFVVHGQSPVDGRLIILGNGLPAVDAGVTFEETHSPSAAEAIRRIAIRTAVQQQRMNDAPLSYVPGRVIVKFRDAAAAADRIDAVRSASSTAAIAERPSYANFDIVRIDQQADAEAVASALRGRREVEYAQPAYRIHAMFVPNDPLYKSNQWNLPLLGREPAWDIQPAAGSAITVAVLDSGLAYLDRTLRVNLPAFRDEFGVRYPALGPQTIPYSAARQVVAVDHPERIVAPHDFIWDNDTMPPLDFDGHGTHVSGTIGQLTNDNIGTAGVAFNVKLMPVKVIDSIWDDLFGAPNMGDDATVPRAIRQAADNGAKVINMSIGRTGPPDTAPAIEDAIRYAVGKGVFIAIAAGNDFEDGNTKEIVAENGSRVTGAVFVAASERQAGGPSGEVG